MANGLRAIVNQLGATSPAVIAAIDALEDDVAALELAFISLDNEVNALPRGEVGYGSAVTTQGSITTTADITGVTVTFTATAGRKYLIIASALVQSTLAADRVRLYITDGSNIVWQERDVSMTANNTPVGVTATRRFVAVGTGSVTFKARLERVGSGTVSSVATADLPAEIIVQDIG